MTPTTDTDAVPRPSSTLAIVGLVCAVLGLVFVPLAIVGLILTIMALRRGQPKGLAVTGIVIASLGVLKLLLIAAIMIPNLLASRVASNEALAAASLKTAVFPAEVAFQSGAYRDDDRNGIGDYGPFTDLAGGGRQLLPPGWNAERPEFNGYRFRIHTDLDRGFVAYGWPVDSSTGRRQFAVTHRGVVHSRGPLSDATQEPGEHALFGGKKAEGYSADAAVDWPHHQR